MGSLPDGQGVPNAIPLGAPSKILLLFKHNGLRPALLLDRPRSQDGRHRRCPQKASRWIPGFQRSAVPIAFPQELCDTQTRNAVRPGIAHRIGPASGDLFAINNGPNHPVLRKLEQETSIMSEWEFHRLAKAGRKQLAAERNQWDRVSENGKRLLAWKGAEA
jgi:hypothetical protein